MLTLKYKIKGLSGLLLLLISASLYAETVYHYEPESVTIVGKVVEKQFAGPPGYGENASDKKVTVTVPVVILAEPVSVLPSADTEDDDPDNQPEQEVRSMQVFSYQGPVTVCGCAKLEGTLMHQVSADHYTKVLLIVKNAQKIANCQ
ncbi:hypothetical protein EV102420_21_00060 [Pseudescherichia vulneris NBRC 102420]|uniref:DUF4431 domain-containing protein n=2 Tax=Pseudescherichia vulneris TaxID=566 RepID=A0A090V448_PSEVU|nr:hypothetical protein EV102420_21_00060 [Pseudescherichia vulneris NBRC 102420]